MDIIPFMTWFQNGGCVEQLFDFFVIIGLWLDITIYSPYSNYFRSQGGVEILFATYDLMTCWRHGWWLCVCDSLC